MQTRHEAARAFLLLHSLTSPAWFFDEPARTAMAHNTERTGNTAITMTSAPAASALAARRKKLSEKETQHASAHLEGRRDNTQAAQAQVSQTKMKA